jgi:hypothetical protein
MSKSSARFPVILQSGVTISNQTNIVMVSEERLRELQAVGQRMIELIQIVNIGGAAVIATR